jgi:hypothetical protein
MKSYLPRERSLKLKAFIIDGLCVQFVSQNVYYIHILLRLEPLAPLLRYHCTYLPPYLLASLPTQLTNLTYGVLTYLTLPKVPRYLPTPVGTWVPRCCHL